MRPIIGKGPPAARWPLTTVLPFVVSFAILIVAVAMATVGVSILHTQNNVKLEEMAGVFLDATAANLTRTTTIDGVSARTALENTIHHKTILGEKAIVLGWHDNGSLRVVRYPEGDPDPRLPEALNEALQSQPEHAAFQIDDDGRALFAKTYRNETQVFAIATLFDAREVVEANRTVLRSAVAMTAGLAIVAALITFLVTRWGLSPLRAFAQRLAHEHERAFPASQPAFLTTEIAALESALELRRQGEETRSRTMRRVAQAERDALLARVAATLAHEIRNPLAGILAALSTFRRFGDDKAVREETLDIVEAGLQSLERITDVTLSAYRQRPGLQEVTARDILDLQLLIAPEAQRKNLAMEWDVPGNLAMTADADAIRQILVNLILNACKASPPGGKVALTAKELDDGVRFSVTDMGSGMPAEIISFLNAGSLAEPPAQRELGIWIVSSLADDMGARLTVESHAGRGTTVSIIVPTRKAEITEETA